MLYSQDEVEGYFDYNSIITLQGKRLRRLRRTEVSSQKLLLMKCKSPHQPGSSTNQPHRLRQNKSSDISPSLAYCRSKLIIKCTSYLQNAFYRSKNQIHAEFQSSANGNLHNFSIQNSISKTQRADPNVKNKMGEYYFGADPFYHQSRQSKKRSLSRSQSQDKSIQKVESCQELVYTRNLKSDYFMSPPNIPNIPKQKTKKKIAIKVVTNNQYALQDLKSASEASNLKSESKISLKQRMEKKSSSKVKLSSPNSKISGCSLKKGQSMISRSQQMIENTPSKDYRKASSHKSYSELYGLEDSRVSKTSKVNNQQVSSMKSIAVEKKESQLSGLSQLSKQSKGSKASKLRSELRSRLVESQLSRKSNNSQISKKIIREADPGLGNLRETEKTSKMILTKKTTDAEESQKASQHFNTPKMNKCQTYGLSEARLSKQETNNTKSTQYSSRQSFNLMSSTSNPELKLQTPFAKKQSMEGKEYTLQKVLKNIQEHDIRLGFLYLFVDNTHECYQTPITFQRYQRLCFLMLKKYLFEKNRLTQALRGEQHCLILTDAQVPKETLDLYLGNNELKDKINNLIEQTLEIKKEIQNQFAKIQPKYKRDRFIRLETASDNFSKEIMKLLMEELTKLYQQLQGEDQDRDQAESNQQRIIEIIEIMFLLSELNGRPVKKFQLLQESPADFNQYYTDNYERIMETTEYFQALRDY